MRAKLKIVDVFTRVPFAGNPAGVVWEEAGLKTEQMQKIAREVNHSETVFLVAAKQAGCFGARFFTPTHELPVAGHPTVALFHSLAEEQVIEGSERATFRQETGAGVFPIELKGGREGSKVFMGQAKPRYEKFAGSVKELGQALGLGSGSIDDDLEPEIVSTGMSHLIVGVNDGQTLDSAEPDANMLAGINNDLGVATTHVFAADAKRPVNQVRARDFAPAVGIAEDPVTGSANGALGAYLAKHGLLGPGPTATFAALQGEQMGRPGRVEVEIHFSSSKVSAVRIGGPAVTVFEGEIVV